MDTRLAIPSLPSRARSCTTTAQVQARHPIARVVAACSLLVDGESVRRDDTDHALPAGAVIDLLPPFAGG